MLVQMGRVDVVVHKRRLDAMLEALFRLRAAHVIPSRSAGAQRWIPSPEERAELAELRYLSARLDALWQLVPAPGPEATADGLPDLPGLRESVEAVTTEIHALSGQLDALRAEQEVLPHHVAALQRLRPLVPELPELSGFQTIALVVEGAETELVEALEIQLSDLAGDRFEMLSGQLEGEALGIVLVVPKAVAPAVNALLGRQQLGQVRLPTELASLSFDEALAAAARRVQALPQAIAEAESALRQTVHARADVLAARQAVRSRIVQLEVRDKLGATDHAAALSCWIPTDELDRVEEVLTRDAGSELVLLRLEPIEGEHPPVLLRNSAVVRPFEFFVRLFETPRYRSVDPTPLMALFMPLFFGMMLGDAVYGTVLLGLSLWAGSRLGPGSPVARDLSRVMALGAAWAVVWGVIFGEYLGDLGRHLLHLEPLWINREEAIAPLLLFAVAVGASHVLLGLLIGLVNAWRVREPHVAVERLGMLAALSGLFGLAGLAANQLPDGTLTPSIAALVVGMVVMGRRHGWAGVLMGPLEVVGLAGNVLSYLRIAAIGMASAYLARVANELGALGPMWIGVVVAALLHTLNLALGAFSPTIQALRLHYVEFFGKFYEHGGEPFVAFGAHREV